MAEKRSYRGLEVLALLLMGTAAVLSVPFLGGRGEKQEKTVVVIEQGQKDNGETFSARVPMQKLGEPVVVSIASSNTKQQWLHEQVGKFQAESLRNPELRVDGRPVRVEILQETIDGKKVDYRSGAIVTHTLNGTIKPTIVSPGEMSWVEKLNKEWQTANGHKLIRRDAPIVARTPVVIAMWQSRAQALGCWPEVQEQCTWEKLNALAKNPAGWGSVGRSEWGTLKFGYGYYDQSNSGTLGIVMMCMAGAGKTSGLQMNDVRADNGCGRMLESIEKAKVHSGKSDIWLLEKMVFGGPEYLDAVITYESNVIATNQKKGADMREPLVSVYPGKKTIVVGHPFAILDGSSWISVEQIAAAGLLRDYLLGSAAQEEVLLLGLRGASPSAPVRSPIEPALGANPKIQLTAMEVPERVVLDQIGVVWHQVKKRAFVAIIFDKSGSMRGVKMSAAIKGAQSFVEAMELPDTLLWMPFDTKVHGILKSGQKAEIGETLVADIGSMAAGGDTALYDAVRDAFHALVAIRKTQGNDVLYSMVVLSDGADTSSKTTLPELEVLLSPLESDPRGVQIHTICIGTDCNVKVLQRIAAVAHGKFWKGNTKDEMVSIYQSIATHY